MTNLKLYFSVCGFLAMTAKVGVWSAFELYNLGEESIEMPAKKVEMAIPSASSVLIMISMM